MVILKTLTCLESLVYTFYVNFGKEYSLLR